MAQPTVLGTDAKRFNFYDRFNLNNLGKLRQYRFQADSNATSGSAIWEFPSGTATSANYNIVWRPYSANQTLFSFDSIISPNSTPIVGAMYNNTAGGFGNGSSGKLPAITSGRYYTFNIGDSTGNNFMAVWETTFNPTVLSVVTQNPTIVCAGGDSVTINVTSNQALNAVENAFLRYSLTNNFASSTLVQLTFNGTNGSVKIPIPAASNSIYFYVFTSKYSLTKLAPNGVVNERYCDLSTLSINNNSNSNYSFTVISAAVPSSNFSSLNYCVGLPTTFNNTSTISSGSINSYSWSFGDGSTSSSSASSFTKTYNLIGNYTVSLTATSDLGCQKTVNQNITINSLPAANSINAN